MPRMITTVLVAVIVALTVAVATPDPAHAFDRKANERTLFKLINGVRAKRGLHTVKVRTSLHRAALSHSRDMIANDYFAHSSLSGASYSSRVKRAGYSRSGYSYWSVGEVIAWGKGTLGTPQSILKKWMRSSGHRAVILTKRWRDVGIGCVRGDYKGMSGVIMYTVDFGRRSG